MDLTNYMNLEMLEFEDIEAYVCDLYLKENKTTIDEADAVLKLLERVKRLDKLRETYMLKSNPKVEFVGHETMEHLGELDHDKQEKVEKLANSYNSYALAKALIVEDRAVDGGIVDGVHSVLIHQYGLLHQLLYKDGELLAGVITAKEITTILGEWEEYLQGRKDM